MEIKIETVEFNPVINHDAISLIKQEDGNWIGYAYKNGKFITERQADPATVLTLLITHE